MKLDKTVQNFRDERSQEMYGKNEYELTIAERMKLDEYIKDYLNPTWKDVIIDGINTGYKVSNTGNIVGIKFDKNISLNKTKNAYKGIILYPQRKKYLVHRLVAQAFVNNPNRLLYTQVDHLNGRKDFNWYKNLEWVTPKENKRRAIDMGLCNPRHGHQKRGSESGVAKYNETQAKQVCELLERGLSNIDISKKLSVPTEFVRSIKRYKAWNHISIKYDFNKRCL